MSDLLMLRRLARSAAGAVVRAAPPKRSIASSGETERKSLTIQQDSSAFYAIGTAPRALASFGSPIRGVDSNVVMSPVMWVMRTFTESVLVVQRRDPDDARLWSIVDDHPLEELIDEPNDFYDGDALWKATALSYLIDGNAYWLKVRNIFGIVVQLWYIPHWLIRPSWIQNDSTFISHYDYTPGMATPSGAPFKILPRDVVHFRFGLDPDNPRFGLSPLRAVLREVMTDDEAAVFSQTILQNMGVPGLFVSPKSDGFKPTKEQAAALKEYLDEQFTGNHRGEAMVSRFPTDVVQLGFDPNKLMLPNLRDLSEERVCAAIGIPAAIVGFGSGLQSTKVGATMRELRRLAWINCLLPMQKTLAKGIDRQLLPDFVAQTRRFRARFDESDVSAFQEDDQAFAARIQGLVTSGLLRVDRGQQALGLQVDQTQRVYLRPSNITVVDENGTPVAGAPPAGSGDGSAAAAPAADDAAGDGSGDVASEPTAGGAESDTADAAQKMLAAIAARWAPAVHFNGNGNGRRG
jgi:HK97 family phage portal protein